MGKSSCLRTGLFISMGQVQNSSHEGILGGESHDDSLSLLYACFLLLDYQADSLCELIHILSVEAS